MPIKSFLDKRIARIKNYDIPAKHMWTIREKSIPEVEKVGYSETIEMDLTMLSVDIIGYTDRVVNHQNKKVVARIMRLYVNEMTAAIRHYGGTITSIEGDGILGAFSSSSNSLQSSQEKAVACAITMYILLEKIVNRRIVDFQQPRLECRYGIDHGKTHIIRAGIRGRRKNDLVFVGRAASLAVNIQSLAYPGQLLVSPNTYFGLSPQCQDRYWGWWRFFDPSLGSIYYLNTSSIRHFEYLFALLYRE